MTLDPSRSPKASTVPDPEEDEGFGDCTQKAEPLRQPSWGSGEPKAGGPPSPHEVPEKERERRVSPTTTWAPLPRAPGSPPEQEGGREEQGERKGPHSCAPPGPGPRPDQLWPAGCDHISISAGRCGH